MRRALPAIVTAAVAATILGSSIATASDAAAGPRIDVDTSYISSEDVGPDKTDWWCTYQLSVNDIVCDYSPGVHRPMKPVIRESVNHWWNPWSW